MSAAEYRELCEEVEASFKDSGKREGRAYRLNCPRCVSSKTGRADMSMGMSGDGLFHCHRCGTGGKLRDGPDPSVQLASDDTDIPEMEPPEGYIPIGHEPGLSAESFEDARAYALSRGITPSIARQLQVGAVYGGYYGGRIIIPMIDAATNKWLGWIGRDWTGRAEKKYLYPVGMPKGSQLWNHDALFIDTYEPLLIVEGALDCIPFWPNAAAVLGQPSHEQKDAMLLAKRPLCIVLDGDMWRAGEALALWLRMQGKRAGAVTLPPRMDPDEVPRGVLLDAVDDSITSPTAVRV